MHHEFTGIVQPSREGDRFIARCLERPAAWGHGRTADEALRSLAEDLALTLQERRDDELPQLRPARPVTVH